MRPNDVAKAVRALIAANRPAFLWGPPGVGKSSVVKQAAEEYGEFHDVRVVYHDPSDVKFPVLRDGELHWVNSLFPKEPDWKGVICLEELPQGPPLMQAAMMQLTFDRCIGDYRLPEGARVVACGNRQEDRAGANRVITPLLNRFVHLDLEVSNEDWMAWAIGANVAPEVRSFLNWKPSLLFDFNPASGKRAFPTPRSWSFVSDVLPHTPDELLLPVAMGCVGEGPAVEFVGFVRIYKSLPDVDAILANPTKGAVPREPAVLWALCGALCEKIRKADSALLGRFVSYVDRMPEEFGIMAFRDATLISPTIFRAPGAGDFMKKHKSVLLGAA